MFQLRLQIVASLLMLTCGSALLWRRRDNIFAYMQGGLFFGTLFLPLVATPVLERFDEDVVRLYAQLLLIGACAFAAGLLGGALFENGSPMRIPVTFARRLEPGAGLETVLRRARVIAGVGAVVLVAAFVLLGYAPLLAADRTSAKYGIGVYRPSSELAAAVYRFALASCSAILPVTLAVLYRRRRLVELALAVTILCGLALTLSRLLIFSGLLIFALAVAVERRVSPLLLVGAGCVVFVLGSLSNEVLLGATDTGYSLGSRVAAGAPDLNDHLLFLTGYENGGESTRGRTIVGGLLPGQGRWDPTSYALRTLTGSDDVSEFGSVGLRLPAPLWGYASFGLPGVVGFSLVAGLFTGWGTRRWMRLLTRVHGTPGSSLNLVLAAVVFNGTVGLLARFYFATSADLVLLAIAVALGASVRVHFRRRTRAPTSTTAPPSPELPALPTGPTPTPS